MIEISLESRVENDTLIIRVVLPEEKLPQYEYAYYFIKDGERMLTKWYSANYEERFVLEEPGAYYVTCFARNIENKNDMASKYTRLYTYPWGEENEKAVFEEKSLSESQFSICSRIEGGILECDVHPSDNKFKDIEFAFYLMNRFEKKETVSYSPYNRACFPLTADGIYSVKCFIRRGQELMVKMSRFHGYRAENTFGLETNICEPFGGGNYSIFLLRIPIQISAWS